MQHGNVWEAKAFNRHSSGREEMPRGAYTSKQERKAEHIEESYEKRGVFQEGSRRTRVADGQ